MAPINKKFRAILKLNSTPTSTDTTNTSTNSDSVIKINSYQSTFTPITNEPTYDQNSGSSDSEHADGNSRNSFTPRSGELSPNVTMNDDYNLNSPSKRSSSISYGSSNIATQFGKLLHSSHRRDNNNLNLKINNNFIIPSPSNSPFDPSSSQSFSFSLSSSPSSLSPSPSTSTITNNEKDIRNSDSPSGAHFNDFGLIKSRIITGDDQISSDNSNFKHSNKSSSEHHHDNHHHSHHHGFHHSSYLHNSNNPFKQSSSSSSSKNLNIQDNNSSSGQSSKIILDKSSEEYRLRRERNNIAVRKSRSKSKIKFLETIDRMNHLEQENSKLLHHIAKMNQELAVLKFFLEKYQDQNYKRFVKMDSMDIPQEMLDRVELGNEIFQIQNFGNSRSNINPFYGKR